MSVSIHIIRATSYKIQNECLVDEQLNDAYWSAELIHLQQWKTADDIAHIIADKVTNSPWSTVILLDQRTEVKETGSAYATAIRAIAIRKKCNDRVKIIMVSAMPESAISANYKEWEVDWYLQLAISLETCQKAISKLGLQE